MKKQYQMIQYVVSRGYHALVGPQLFVALLYRMLRLQLAVWIVL